MSKTIYATFASEQDAERAAGALRDHGVPANDLSFVLPVNEPSDSTSEPSSEPLAVDDTPEVTATMPSDIPVAPPALPSLPTLPHLGRRLGVNPGSGLAEDVMGMPSYRYDALGAVIPDRPSPSKQTAPEVTALAGDSPREAMDHEPRHVLDMHRELPMANSGISTTTSGDAAKGALEGTGIGLGLGLALGLGAIFIPGVGFVAGAGALIAGLTAATAAAGGIAGGVVGYLVDLGVPSHAAHHISSHLETGAPMLSVSLSGATSGEEVVALLEKYGANFVEAY